MRTLAATIIAFAVIAASRTDDALPPGHPPVTRPAVPALPPGHPPLPDAPAPRPAPPDIDVAAIGDIVAAYYASLSGPPGAQRDWERFASLFRGDARLVTVMPSGAEERVLELTPAQFEAANRTYFERGGYFESAIAERVVTFGHIAHVWSTYESRHRRDDPAYTRGVNSFQLVSAGGRWWIAGVAWDRERPGTSIPPEYLPATNP